MSPATFSPWLFSIFHITQIVNCFFFFFVLILIFQRLSIRIAIFCANVMWKTCLKFIYLSQNDFSILYFFFIIQLISAIWYCYYYEVLSSRLIDFDAVSPPHSICVWFATLALVNWLRYSNQNKKIKNISYFNVKSRSSSHTVTRQ